MMDMYSRNQYLKELKKEYLKTKSKKEKGKLLDEAEKRTGLNRKYRAELKRIIDKKLDLLYKAYQEKNKKRN